MLESINAMTPEQIWQFIAGEIPFLLFMALLIYVLFIRPKRMEKKKRNDQNGKTQMGDEILFKDGMVGIITKYKDGIVYIESGSYHSKYKIKDDMFSRNLSAEARVKEAYSKLSFGQKILSKI